MGVMRDPGGDESVLYVDCTNVSIFIGKLGYSFARCYQLGELAKGYG